MATAIKGGVEGAAWAEVGDPLYVFGGHYVSPRDNFGEIGRKATGELRRPNRISAGTGGFETPGPSTFGATQLTGNLTFFPDATFNIGDGADRPRDITLSRDLFAGRDIDVFQDMTAGRDVIADRDALVARDVIVTGALGHFLAGLGTEAAPALSFVARDDLGFFSPLANTLAVVTVGTTRWRWEPGGNFVAQGDNLYSIGNVGANRPEDVRASRAVVVGTDPGGSSAIRMSNGLRSGGGGELRFDGYADGAGAGAGTLTNAPTAGDPAFWIPINIAGAVRFIPCWP